MNRFWRKGAALAAARRSADEGIKIQREAKTLALSEVSDAQLAAKLAQALVDIDPDEIQRQISGWFPRGNYFDDRGYRLLVGAATGTVPRIEAQRQEQFDRELRLGHMPLVEAFAEVAKTDPVLNRLESELRTSPLPQRRVGQYIRREQKHSKVLGAGMGNFEYQLAYAYLVRISVDKSVDRSYLENPMFEAGHHGTLGAGPP